jgi:hypothetical protein
MKISAMRARSVAVRRVVLLALGLAGDFGARVEAFM